MHRSGRSASNRYSRPKVINAFAEVRGFSPVDRANRNACQTTQGRATRGCPYSCIWSDTPRWDFGEVRAIAILAGGAVVPGFTKGRAAEA